MDNKIGDIEDEFYWHNRPINDTRKDWRFAKEQDWVSEYWESQSHPHRQLIIDALEKLKPFSSVLEIGCNAGPNLAVIQKHFPGIELAGIDISGISIEKAREMLPGVLLQVGRADNLPYRERGFDVVLTDAVLMYVGPGNIDRAMDEIARVASRGIILCEWDNDSKTSEVLKNFHWARDYKTLLEERSFEVEKIKITEEFWPSKNWAENGYIYIAKRA